MSTFKVGDTVRRLQGDATPTLPSGSVGTVSRVSSMGQALMLHGKPGWWSSLNFELVARDHRCSDIRVMRVEDIDHPEEWEVLIDGKWWSLGERNSIENGQITAGIPCLGRRAPFAYDSWEVAVRPRSTPSLEEQVREVLMDHSPERATYAADMDRTIERIMALIGEVEEAQS